MSKMGAVAKALKGAAGKAKGVTGRVSASGMAAKAGSHVKDAFAKHPVLSSVGAAGLALPIADWGVGLGKDGIDALTGSDDEYRRKLAVQEMLLGMNENVAQDARNQLIQMNTMKLMQTDPQLAQQLMVGRKLPPAAAMFGVKPRRDLIEEVAEAMSNGQFVDDTPGGDPLAGFLGG